MDIPLHFLVPDAERFAALVQRRSLAGLHFEPMPPLRVRDRYLDTERGALLEAGYTLRLRVQDGGTVVTLRPLAEEERVTQRIDGEADALPEGPVRDAVAALAGEGALEPLLVLQQYRLPRGIYDGRRLLGVLSFDAVTDLSAPEPVNWHEVEIKRTARGASDDLRRLTAELRDLGLEPAERGKFERALIRLDREADGALHLLPDERAVLEALRTSTSSIERRRAEVLLLAAEGLPTRTISYKASLSPSRVRHWKHAFRHERLGIFDSTPAEAASGPPAALPPKPRTPPAPPGFRRADLVASGRSPRPDDAEIASVFEAVLDAAHRHPGTPRLGDEGAPERHRR